MTKSVGLARDDDDASFQSLVQWALDGERTGHLVFEAMLGERSSDHDELALLSEVEGVTAEVLRSISSEGGSVESAVSGRAAERSSSSFRSLEWSEFVTMLARGASEAMPQFERLVESAPPRHKRAAGLVRDHEQAIVEYCRAVLARDSTSRGPLEHYLQRAKEYLAEGRS